MWGLHWSEDRWSFTSISNYTWSMDPPCSYSPVSECIIGIDTLSNWKNFYGLKATGISPPYQDSKPREISEINATSKNKQGQ